MRLGLPFIAGVALSLMAGAALACDPVMDERPLHLVKSQSKRVTVDSQCRTKNIGVYDAVFLEPAVDLGNGRVMQEVVHQGWKEKDQALVFLADCNLREATLLQGTETLIGLGGCGNEYSYADLVGEKAIMSLDVGANLNELVDLAEAKGAEELSPSEYFFNFNKVNEDERHPVSKKDRFDLLCGCKVFYPDSPGGKK